MPDKPAFETPSEGRRAIGMACPSVVGKDGALKFRFICPDDFRLYSVDMPLGDAAAGRWEGPARGVGVVLETRFTYNAAKISAMVLGEVDFEDPRAPKSPY